MYHCHGKATSNTPRLIHYYQGGKPCWIKNDIGKVGCDLKLRIQYCSIGVFIHDFPCLEDSSLVPPIYAPPAPSLQ